MIYGLVALLLILGILGYFRLADHYNIIDKPNERSSHSKITIRGGGVVFPLAVILWYLFFGFSYPWFALGAVCISIISFLDDIYTLSTKPRLAVHLLSVIMLMYSLGLFAQPFYWWIIAIILIIGWINAFNFMDGINGITAFYSLSVLIPLYWLNSRLSFVADNLILVIAMAVVVFAFFNARKRARTFAGDVGSVSMAFILAFLMIRLIMATHSWVYIAFVGAYGVDAVLTIVHRLFKRENIFKAHRSHLYQYMANELKMPHVLVSSIYAVVQLLVSFAILEATENGAAQIWTLAMLILLGIIYIVSKRSILKNLALKTSS